MQTAIRYLAIFAIAAALLGSTGCFLKVEHHRDSGRVERRIDVDVRSHHEDGGRTVERREESHEVRSEAHR